ncbi:uncharacterized protein LOC116121782 [Pistacia vera]|uniref:uncharacterized protein LOC116121782 n=1 Tax=Pistacia vera TaxID=55513 RepID=UPI001263BB04|nr:uncharacterized protein LOC116121782 [Pistacia vera]
MTFPWTIVAITCLSNLIVLLELHSGLICDTLLHEQGLPLLIGLLQSILLSSPPPPFAISFKLRLQPSSLHSSSLQPLQSSRSPPLQSTSSGSSPVLFHSRSPSSFSFSLQVFNLFNHRWSATLLLPCCGWFATLQFRHSSVMTSTSVQSLHSSTSSLQRFNLFNHRRRHLKACFLLAVAGLPD